jgi:hypothetical protein
MEDERGLDIPGQPVEVAPEKQESEPVAENPPLAEELLPGTENESEPIGESPAPTIQASPAILYDGSPSVGRELRLAFPLGKVEAYQSRKPDGTSYYDTRGGQNAFVLDGKAYFAGEEVK